MNLSIADLRLNYTRQSLLEADIHPDPIQQFQIWFNQAVTANLLEPNAMTLATASTSGTPSARIVLLKGVDERGFVFYTNYNSQKGQELISNPQAALVFLWGELERQVRIAGAVEKIADQETEMYFHSRPKSSQLGAWASEQSQVIPNREVLEQRLADLDQEYQNQDVPRPAHWGGFRVVPHAIEFWQGRPSRLHDRLRYQFEADNWMIERLSP
ncbi:pyridoxamine 5'-phosphate oxidase [Phormidium sp. CLA17]|uniref:pyridoxamine 5'-phosphate oxidase n=1 Tax=Leptolyngbya sp. Cla-17 TaxID=2803751 RepID=UPI001492D98D|nr:pyridoxamine 5'-phosphate oxidase [Leptolyngbya sp. Cla-17]MBM0742396.1 pyridoxamine 5'-phosphate oxidase [Leptolyngbya sp. Cla-17]